MSDAEPAATLILLREGPDGPELFMVERAQTMGFAAGAMVFPGGKVEPGDAVIAADPALGIGFDALDLGDAQARVAALRETFEEAGTLLSQGPSIDTATRCKWRKRLSIRQASFATFLRHIGHRLCAHVLTPFAHWRPPIDFKHRRYDTRFYIAAMPTDETAEHDGNEAVASRWIRPADALARADADLGALIFPTRRNLERLAIYNSLEALVEAASALPIRLIQPFIEERGGRPHLCIPEDCGYPITAEPLDRSIRG